MTTRRLAVLSALSLLAMLAAAPADAAFARRKLITLNRAQVPGGANLVSFPVLVSMTDANLRTTANGGFVTSAQGHDILFLGETAATCAPAGSGCRLDHEIESYDPATGALVAWVRVPTLLHAGAGANSQIGLYYGDATVTCSQQNAAGVWDADYREVFHLNETGDHTDSTANAFTATANGAYTKGAAGRIGRAIDLAGGTGATPAYLNVSDGGFPLLTSFTLEAWVNFRTQDPAQYIGLVVKGRECRNFDGSPDVGTGCPAAPCGDWIGLYKLPDGGGNGSFSVQGDYGETCAPGGLTNTGVNVLTGGWYHVAGIFPNGGQRRLLVNGVVVATDAAAVQCLDAAIPHYTRVGTDSNGNYFDGQMDELRVSFSARSVGWIQTGYNNQNNPATFYASVVDSAGPFAVTPSACPAANPCAGGPGSCNLRSIGTAANYATGTVSATNGSAVVTGAGGAAWQSANRGRGDRINIQGVDYTIRSVDAETQLQLTTPYAGATGAGKAYSIARQFVTPQAWEDCVSGGAACSFFPIADGGNLVAGSRSEVGVVYEDATYTGAGGVPIVEFNGATTDATHTVTLTADGANRHYGVSGAGVVFDNAANGSTAVRIQDQHVTFEWIEVRNGGGAGNHCIDYNPSASANHAVIRFNIVRNCSGQSIRLSGTSQRFVADIHNNVIYRGAREGVRLDDPLGTGTGSRVDIFNNTFYRNNGATAQPNTEVSSVERPNPYVTLRNNLFADDAQAPDVTWNGGALCTNAAGCDWWNSASGHNATGDAAPPTGNWKSDVGPNPRGFGLTAATEASLAFVNTGVGTENLHLLAGSAAFNRALAIGGMTQADIDAQLRTGPWDMGADELPASSAPPLVVMSDNAASGPRALRYSTYAAGVWSAPAGNAVPGPFSTGAPLFSKVARTHPNGTRRAAVVSENDGAAGGAKLHVSFWDGANWDGGTGVPFADAQQFTTTLSTPITTRHFDAAYEQQSGELLVATGANTDETVFIWTYNGSAWSGDLSGTPFGNGSIGSQGEDVANTFRWVHLEPRPGTNQIALLVSGLDVSTSDSSVVSAAIWDGNTNTFGSKQILSFPSTGPNGVLAQNPHVGDALDVDFVLGGGNAGEAVAVWGTQTQLWRRIWNPSTGWASSANLMVQDLGVTNTVRWIRQKANSVGDDLVLALEDVNERIFTVRYDGNTRAFQNFSAAHSTTAYGNADLNRPFDVVWDLGTSASSVLLVYSDATGLRYRTSADGGVTWSPQSTLTVAFQAHWVQLERDPSNVVHLVVKDQNDDLQAWSWRAGTWTLTTPVPPSTNIENNSTNQNVETFAIASYPPVATTTAVKLQSFEAAGVDRAVELAWRTGSELDNQGFHLHRAASPDGPWTRLTRSLIPGLGSSPLGRAYSYSDQGLVNGQRYYYRLEDVDAKAKSTFHGPVSAVPQAAAVVAAEPKGDARRGRKSRSEPRNECPAWVETEYRANAPDAAAGFACTKHGEPEATSLEVVSRDARGSVVELRTGGFYAVHEADGAVRVFVPGFDAPEDPDAPALPLRRALVEAVVGRKARLVSAAAYEQKAFRGLRPAALGEAAMQLERDGTVRPGRLARAARHRDGLVPREVARLGPSVFQGEAKSVVVELSPLRYDVRGDRLLLAGRVRLRLAWSARDPREAGAGSRGRRRPREPQPSGGEVLAELFTTRSGAHGVSFETLFPGREASFPVSELALRRLGLPMPYRVEPSGGSFGRGSVLYFYAPAGPAATDFSSEIAWQLTRGGSGALMTELDGRAAGATLATPPLSQASFEVNRYYQPGLLEAADPWLWDSLPSGAVKVKAFTLAGVDTGSALPAELAVLLQGATDAPETAEDHHVRIAVNGIDVGEALFDGKRPARAVVSLPASLLREGTNELALTNVGDTGAPSMLFLDRFELRHPRTARLLGGGFEGSWLEAGTAELASASGPLVVLDVTEAQAGRVSWLAGAAPAAGSLRFRVEPLRRYVAASAEALLRPRVAAPAVTALRAAANQADYLLIAPRAFLAAGAPLVERRQAQGLRSRAVAFEDVVSAFGHGQAGPEAIRDFLRHAYHQWQRPSPRYVLLLGDASYDPRNFMGSSLAAPLPALWQKTSYLVTASDPGLAAVNGDDDLPDLAIGRLPARTAEEAALLVAKLLAFEDSGQGFEGRALFVADNPDVAGDFAADVRDVAQSFMAGRDVQFADVGELGSETRTRVLDALDGGLAHLAYVGHGGAAVWASENVLTSWDATTLQAQSRQPLLVTMNCLNGYFVAPGFDALAEAFVKADGRGAIAAFSPSGLSLDGPAHVLHRALTAELTGGRHARLGDAVLAAQKAYAETGAMPELLGVYHLFGDPALSMR